MEAAPFESYSIDVESWYRGRHEFESSPLEFLANFKICTIENTLLPIFQKRFRLQMSIPKIREISHFHEIYDSVHALRVTQWVLGVTHKYTVTMFFRLDTSTIETLWSTTTFWRVENNETLSSQSKRMHNYVEFYSEEVGEMFNETWSRIQIITEYSFIEQRTEEHLTVCSTW